MDSAEKKITLYNRIIFVLAIVGIVMGAYVTQSFLRGSSILCVNDGCELVRKSPASYIFGIPVPAFGLAGYSVIAILTFLRTMNHELHTKLVYGVLGVATFGVLFVGWFTYTELFVIKGICTWCAISAVNMLVIFGLTVYSMKLSRQKSKIS